MISTNDFILNHNKQICQTLTIMLYNVCSNIVKFSTCVMIMCIVHCCKGGQSRNEIREERRCRATSSRTCKTTTKGRGKYWIKHLNIYKVTESVKKNFYVIITHCRCKKSRSRKAFKKNTKKNRNKFWRLFDSQSKAVIVFGSMPHWPTK